MKDLYIPAKNIRKEAHIFLWCLVAAFGMNIIAIIYYQTNWIELFTTIHITLAIALGFYVLLGIIRLISAGVSRLFHDEKKLPSQ